MTRPRRSRSPGRDARMTGRARLAIDAPRRLHHAFEIRNESFLDAHFIALLRRYGIALVVADTGGKWPSPTDVTADFLYLRLHGATELYRSRYSEASLRKWARRIHAWRSGTRPDDDTPVVDAEPPRRPRDVYCYFDNTDKLHAPANARRLQQLVDEFGNAQAAARSRRMPTRLPARAAVTSV